MLLHNALTCEISHTSSVLGRGAGGSVHLPLCAMLFLSQNSWKASLMLDGVGNVKAWASRCLSVHRCSSGSRVTICLPLGFACGTPTHKPRMRWSLFKTKTIEYLEFVKALSVR